MTIFGYKSERLSMGKLKKLLERLVSEPKDFTWDEFESLMSVLGYKKCKSGKTSGSRRRYKHAVMAPIILHEPHPQRILKHYQLEIIIERLEKEGIL